MRAEAPIEPPSQGSVSESFPFALVWTRLACGDGGGDAQVATRLTLVSRRQRGDLPIRE